MGWGWRRTVKVSDVAPPRPLTPAPDPELDLDFAVAPLPPAPRLAAVAPGKVARVQEPLRLAFAVRREAWG